MSIKLNLEKIKKIRREREARRAKEKETQEEMLRKIKEKELNKQIEEAALNLQSKLEKAADDKSGICLLVSLWPVNWDPPITINNLPSTLGVFVDNLSKLGLCPFIQIVNGGRERYIAVNIDEI